MVNIRGAAEIEISGFSFISGVQRNRQGKVLKAGVVEPFLVQLQQTE